MNTQHYNFENQQLKWSALLKEICSYRWRRLKISQWYDIKPRRIRGENVFCWSILNQDVATEHPYIPRVYTMYIFHARGHGIVKLPIGFEDITLSTSISYWLFFSMWICRNRPPWWYCSIDILVSICRRHYSREQTFAFELLFSTNNILL